MTGISSNVAWSSDNLPLCSTIVVNLLKLSVQFSLRGKGNTDPVLSQSDNTVLCGDFTIARALSNNELYASDSQTEINQWLDFAQTKLMNISPDTLAVLDQYLRSSTYLVGYKLSLADIAVYSSLAKAQFKGDMLHFQSLTRWWNTVQSMKAFASSFGKLTGEAKRANQPRVSKKNTTSSKKGKSGGGASGGMPDFSESSTLPKGRICTRFPPEPSGYLHIGHVKAAMLNEYYGHEKYKGKMILRFDDTNSVKEKAEYVDNIIKDLARLGIVPDKITHTSDSFDLIIDYARKMIKMNLAYMDNTDGDTMSKQRFDKQPSSQRDRSMEDNLNLFELMLKGDAKANGYCLRAKIAYDHKNSTMRDPCIFRANSVPHHRTGTKYKAYPTYDFACPIVDSHEGVSHAMRTTEYTQRNEQYAWFQEKLGLRVVRIQDFGRLNFNFTVMSKRKLLQLVEMGEVDGWNDPRFPTVQGILRRGVQVSALKQFILSQGFSKRVVDMEWDKFWSLNRKVLDPTAPRLMAISKDSKVEFVVNDLNAGDSNVEKGLRVALHPKNPNLGCHVKFIADTVYIESDDAATLVEGTECTLMRYGNVFVDKVVRDPNNQVVRVEGRAHPEGDFKKTKVKLTWVAKVDHLVEVETFEFDRLISKNLEKDDNILDFLVSKDHPTKMKSVMLGDAHLKQLKEGAIVQIERRGYYRVDQPYSPSKPMKLFLVPDGKKKAMSTLSTKLQHR
eukprot:g4623.t1